MKTINLFLVVIILGLIVAAIALFPPVKCVDVCLHEKPILFEESGTVEPFLSIVDNGATTGRIHAVYRATICKDCGTVRIVDQTVRIISEILDREVLHE